MLKTREDLVKWFEDMFRLQGDYKNSAETIVAFTWEYSALTGIPMAVPQPDSGAYRVFLGEQFPRVKKVFWWFFQYTLTYLEPLKIIQTIARTGKLGLPSNNDRMVSWALAMCDAGDTRIRLLENLAEETRQKLVAPFVAAARTLVSFVFIAAE